MGCNHWQTAIENGITGVDGMECELWKTASNNEIPRVARIQLECDQWETASENKFPESRNMNVMRTLANRQREKIS